jgi:hypothetical protein
MTVSGRVWRIVVGASAVILAYHMANTVDQGVSRQWPNSLQIVWGVALILLMLYGALTIAQVLRPLLGLSEVDWLPSRDDLRGPDGILAVLVVALCIFAGIAAVALLWPQMLQRAAMVGLGMFIVALVLLKTRAFWDLLEELGWRQAFGDRLVGIAYVLIGLALIIFGLLP